MADKRIKNQRKGSSDDFQTPLYAVPPLFDYINPHWSIWEPACGKGNIVRAFRSWGYNATGTDLKRPAFRDFLAWTPGFSYDCIITNPPFSIKNKFIARCYELEVPFALLLPYTALETPYRQKYWKKGLQLIFMDKRIDFETPSGEGTGAWFPTAWFTWGLNLPSDMVWTTIDKPRKSK